MRTDYENTMVMRLTALIAALAWMANPSTPAMAAYSESPVSVNACSITNVETPVSYGDSLGSADNERITGSQLQIEFVNTGSKQIRAITFDVAGSGQTEQVRDIGRFAPGVTISHTFSMESSSDGGATNCRVTSVDYGHGT